MTRDELIAALEKAEAGSRELDAEIAFATGWRMAHGHWWTPEQAQSARKRHATLWSTGEPVRECPAFTTSLDSALTLVPEGWAWMVGCAPGDGYFAELQTMGDGLPYDESGNIEGATPALAICIAALRARGEP